MTVATMPDKLEVRLVADGDMGVWYLCRRAEIHGYGEPESDTDRCLLLGTRRRRMIPIESGDALDAKLTPVYGGVRVEPKESP